MKHIKIQIWGKKACFSRPDIQPERYSYDVITPSAARGILESIYWKPQFKWVIDKLYILSPIKSGNIRVIELGEPLKTLRSTRYLKDVNYVIEAHIEAFDNNYDKHYGIFFDRASQEKCFHQPWLGLREYTGFYRLVEDSEIITPILQSNNFGPMLYDKIYNSDKPNERIMFESVMNNGIIDVENSKII